MARFIDGEYLEHILSCIKADSISTESVIKCVRSLEAADVIERSEYNKLLEENKALKECITIITNEQLRTAFKIKDLMKEIKKLQEQTRWTEEGLNEWSRYQSILHILKKIEENK